MIIKEYGMDIKEMRLEAKKSPCKVIKFSANDGKSTFSYNGEFYADCEDCKRTDVEQPYPVCKANHAEWGVLAKLSQRCKQTDELYIYCMTPDGKDYPFTRFWCTICAVLLPMFGVNYVQMWDGSKWVLHDAKKLIEETKIYNR